MERERGWGGGGGSEINQNLPLAPNFVFRGIPEKGRARLELVLSRSASQRRAAKRTVAYRPAVSIRLSRSLGFPTCLFLASPLSGCASGAQGCQGRSNFSSCFSFLESHSFFTESFSWVSEGRSPLKETQTVKKYFWRWSTPGSPPRGP